VKKELKMTAHKKLELQSDRIEMVLASHKAPARVTGGVVTPRAVQFHLTPSSGTRLNKVQSLAEELALALGVVNVRVSRQGSSLQLEVPRDDAQPVKLLSLMARLAHAGSSRSRVPFEGKPLSSGVHSSEGSPSQRLSSSNLRLPPGTAVLGLCDDGAPLLIRLPSPDVAHILVSGTTGSGKTALCRTIILSLAMTHRRSQLQFVLVDPKRRAFAPFSGLPHLLQPIIGDASEAIGVLGDLVRLMETRGRILDNNERWGYEETEGPGKNSVEPHIVVVLDELADLMQVAGKALSDHLTRLAQRGREAGIHVIACTQKPSSQVVGTLIRANFPVRLVGKVVSPEDARVAAGIGGTGAEKLAGRGDFIAVATGQVLRFQVAYVGAAEMSQVVSRLASVRSVGGWSVIPPRRTVLEQAAALLL
jgi:S-DNA-T family DNA segregation ATPase FtsK/SpoIIIE